MKTQANRYTLAIIWQLRRKMRGRGIIGAGLTAATAALVLPAFSAQRDFSL